MIDNDMTRRGFIGTGGTAVAAAVAAGPAAALASPAGPRVTGRPLPGGVTFPATPPRRKRPDSVGIAIVGLGDYALNQMMPRFAQTDRTHIAAIVSGNPDKLARVGDAYGVPRERRYGYDAFARIAADRAIDAVCIVLPTGLHAEWAIRAFAAGKHVLCEKPMALTSADCARMIAAAARANRRLMIAYRVHFEPYNIEAMRLMRQRALGDLRLIRTEQSYRMGPTGPAANWRASRALAGGGPLEDYGIYGLQAALYLAGEMPDRIGATAFRPAGDPRFAEIFAHVAAQLRFPSGAVAQLATSYDSAATNAVEVRGTAGALVMDAATGYAGQTMRIEGADARTLSPGDPGVQFAAMLDHFADVVRDDAPIRTPGDMGLRDLRLIEAIHASAQGGQTVRLLPDGTMRR